MRVDSASRVIRAAPAAVYRAFLDPAAVRAWLPPEGMRAEVEAFEPWQGGRFRLTLAYIAPDHPAAGKATADTDIVQGRFAELRQDERVVQLVEFESADPAFAGTMRMTWSLAAVPDGTEVTVTARDVPAGIRPEDHAAGFASTLANLASFVE